MRLPVLPGIPVLALAAAVVLAGPQALAAGTSYSDVKQGIAEKAVSRAISQAMPVELAYSAIPHQRTAFRADLTGLPTEDATYLAALFALTDAGVIERVSIQQAMSQGTDWSPSQSNYDAILHAIAALDTPKKLLPVERLVFLAIVEQRRYLEKRQASGNPRLFDRGDRLVASSHGKLISAYRHLMRLYRNEQRHNKQAFFDHLCALDFI